MSDESLNPAMEQLRTVVCSLGGIVLVMSLVLTGFIWKQTRNVASVAGAQQQQLQQLQGNVQKLGAVVNDLAQVSADRPDWMAIFRNHGVDVRTPAR